MPLIDYIYFTVLLLAAVSSILNWPLKRREDKILSSLLFLTLISESIAQTMAIVYHNNMIVFHFFNPIQFLLISLYYNYNITLFKKNNLGIYIGVFGVVLSILNSIFLQKMVEFNNYFLLLEGLLIIGMSLQFFLEIVQKNSFFLFKNKHFWISVIFLFFWSASYTHWALSPIYLAFDKSVRSNIYLGIWSVNMICYGGLSIIFILNKKNILHNEY